MTEQSKSRNGEVFRQIADQFPAKVPSDDFKSEFAFAVKLDFRDWRRVLVALQATDAVSEQQPSWATLHKALHEAHTHIERLAKIISATRGEAFKDWAMGEREPYAVAQRAVDFVYRPLPNERSD